MVERVVEVEDEGLMERIRAEMKAEIEAKARLYAPRRARASLAAALARPRDSPALLARPAAACSCGCMLWRTPAEASAAVSQTPRPCAT